MEEGRPRSSLSLASSASTISSLGSLSTKKPTRAVSKVHAFGKRSNALRRDPNLPVHIRGWLHKQDSSGLRLWKRRWFVLSGHCLFYYKDSREESVLGSVLLPSYSIRPDGPGAPRGRRFTFTAEHPGMRTYVLAADTLEDLRGWLRALGRASRAEGDDCGQPRSPARPQPGEGPGGPGGPPEVSRGEEGRGSESPEVARLSRGRGRPGLLAPSPTADLQFGPRIRRTRSPDLFTPLSRPPSPLSLPRPRSAPARRPPPSSGDTAPSAIPHTPLSRIDVRPPLDWGPQRQTLSRPPTPRRGLSSEAGGGKPPRSPQHWSQETRIPAPSSSSTYLQLPPRPPGTGASMVLLPGPPLDSTFHQSLETDTLLTKLCGQDRLLRRLQEEIDRRQEEKEQLEAALELTRQQMGQTTREAAAPGRAWGRQRLLQDRLVSVRATLCHLTQERERVWDTYSGLEQELGTLRETLEYLLHLGSPQDRVSAQQQLWMVEDTLAGLGGPQKPPPHTEPDSPSPALQGEESSERESLPESLELSSPRSPEADWGRPPGGDRELASPRSGLGSPRVSRASSPEGRRPPSPQPGTKVPLARPRMSAQEQLERIRRNQECGRPLPRPASPRLLTLGRTLSPARRQPDAEPKPVLGHSVAQKWLRSSGSWSSPRNTIPYLPTSEGHRERVLSLSQALATEASQWHRMMTSGNVDSRGDPLPPAPPPPSDPTLQVSSPPRSPPVTDFRSTRFSRGGGGGRDAGPTSWEANWDSGAAPPALIQDEGAWPLRVTLLQSSF
ncbi:pleckstrin homology domain-containing family A member 4 isoform X1 [Camelus dromedarius]|uniref:pleckstrin homology domain-containing family A member 4 isoform X1 n=1 Tax=Camelus dromedarius TaxID=9838 RepID=UPI0012636BA3|nr:pleckstrin homology domain-containing family A member 4 isoform X1 [Camelus dromedarius]XP_031314884.1 pleckstrin homology domain-containing family A member 4 isoform X1 [Camelus dromedarius]XP_031314885.1 pleckstrin homology domain-containing family A member 4 isoform X1 [Camelus dromedarius]